MALYLVQATIEPESWRALLAHPEDRREAAGRTIEAAGGRLHGLWYAFGPTDAYLLVELPGNVEAAAVSLLIASSGHYRSLATTVLLDVEELLAAVERVGTLPYRAPGE
ncbi:MAG: GYD domain-containing protein [Thermoleophilia bacterium]